ncbi:protein root hair defective 3, partial [Tanacetum coccineum]
VAMLRERFSKSTEAGGLAGDRQGVIPASGFSLSAQQIWKVIKENKDLDLPSHKVMVANIRCEEIANEEFSSFTENEEWLKLKELVKSNFVPGFGKKVSSLLGHSLSSYDKEATLKKVLVLLTYQSMLKHMISGTSENFKNAFIDALNEGKGFALAARDCTEKFMTLFDEHDQDAVIEQGNWDSSKERDAFSSDLDSYITEVLNTKLSVLTTLNKSKLEEALYEYRSSRDANGHGTHMDSTEVCWEDGKCSEADVLVAFDEAIHDGVNVISASFGSPPPLVPLLDSSSDIGSFHAMQKGISVVFSAGNNGPDPSLVLNVAPWSTCVGASSIDQNFPTKILVDAPTRQMNVTKVHIFPSKTVIKQSPAPVVAEFSSRGPNSMSPYILKTPMDLGAICNNLENELKYIIPESILARDTIIDKETTHSLELAHGHAPFSKYPPMKPEFEKVARLFNGAATTYPDGDTSRLREVAFQIVIIVLGFPTDLGIIYALLETVITTLNALFVDKACRKPLLLVSAMGLVYQYPSKNLLLNNCSSFGYFSPSSRIPAPKLLQLIFFVFLEEILLNCPLWLPVNHTKRRDALMPFSTTLRVFFHIKKKIRQIEGKGKMSFKRGFLGEKEMALIPY